MKALFVCGYHVGARKGELRRLRWEQVDFEANQIRLAARETKGKRARSLPIFGEMEPWLKSQLEKWAGDCPWVFSQGGKPIGDHLKGWREACERAGVPGLLFHDLRRSAVRNMKRAGNSERTVMEISGHKTRAIFDRYDIVTDADIAHAARRTEEYLNARKEPGPKLKRVK